jgi:uncharacterized membrane protein YbjE (DUF340 family)
MIYLFLCLGIIIGFYSRKKQRILEWNSKITNLAIYGLLFFLGIGIGANQDLLQKLPLLGLKALYITFFALLGSLFAAKIVVHFFFKDEK